MSDDTPRDDKEVIAHEQVIPGVTPGALLDAMDDPEVFAKVARGDLYVQMAEMRRLSRSPEFPTGQRVEYAKFLAKMGRVENPGQADNPLAGLPLIEIDLGDTGSVKISPAMAPAKPAEKEVGPVNDQGVGETDEEVKLPSQAVLP